MTNRFRAVTTVLATSFLALAALPAGAGTITLKLSHTYPDTHYLSVEGIKPFAEEVKKRTNGEVSIDIFPASQLGKGQSALIKSRMVDLAYIVPSLEAEKFPLSSVMELPTLFKSSCDGTQKLWTILQPGGVLDKQEYAPQGYRVLYIGMMAPYDVFTTSKKVAAPEDLQGLKLRGNGAAISKSLRSLGAVPVSLASSESYDAVSRGTIDGMYFPASGILPYSLETHLKHVLTGLHMGSAGAVMAISERTFKKLSPTAQKALTDIGMETQDRLCAWLDRHDAELHKRFVDEFKMEMVTLTPEQSAAWTARVQHVVAEWFDEMARVGKDGKSVVSTMGINPTN